LSPIQAIPDRRNATQLPGETECPGGDVTKRIGNLRSWGVVAAAALTVVACGGGGGGSGSSSSGGAPPPPPPTPPAITGPATALPAATAGTAAMGATIIATGTAPITFSISSGSLPSGMALNASTGAIAGTPLVSGAYAFTVTATNAGGTASAPFTQDVSSPTPNANLLLDGNRLVTLNTLVPTDFPAPIDITGLVSGENVVAITRRPANGFLYGLAVNPMGEGRLYALHPATGFARSLGLAQSFVLSDGATARPIDGTRYGMHVSPADDVMRVSTDTGLNFRFDLTLGSGIDSNLIAPGRQMDAAINGATTRVDGISYTDSRLNASVSTLYTIDSAIDSLCIQSPFNSGVQTSCLPLSSGVDAVVGFDIPPSVGVTVTNNPVTAGSATAIFQLAGETAQRIGQIDLTNGAIAASRPTIGTGGIRSVALQTPAGIPMYALRTFGSQLLAFSSENPSAVTARTLTGVVAGETIVGIDFRPATGHLYGFGVNPTANTGTLYIIELATGNCTPFTIGGIAYVDGGGVAVDFPNVNQGYGFDFDPVTDRMRVTTGTGLNFRVNPVAGVPIDGDTAALGVQPDATLSPATVDVPAIAYTNTAEPGGGVTTLYAVNTFGDHLCILTAETGLLSSCEPIQLGLQFTPISDSTGFDIPAGVRAPSAGAPVDAGVGYLAATVLGGATNLYEINLVTRTVVDRGPIGDGVTSVMGLAIGVATAR
jgi:hypothetical protein